MGISTQSCLLSIAISIHNRCKLGFDSVLTYELEWVIQKTKPAQGQLPRHYVHSAPQDINAETQDVNEQGSSKHGAYWLQARTVGL